MPSTSPTEPAALGALMNAFLGDLSGLRPRANSEREHVFALPPRGSLDDRWHVYTHGYVARVAEALCDEYAAVERILGPTAFESLVARYLMACPPRSFDLAHAGDRLASFLESDPLTTELPFLPELAELERALAQAFVAPDARPLDWEALRHEDPAVVADRPLALAPGTRLLRSAWPLVDLWNCRRRGDDQVDVELRDRPQTALVYRRGFVARCEALDDGAARLVEAAAQGLSLAQALGDAPPSTDETEALRLLAAFRRLASAGVFVETWDAGRAGVA